MKPILINLDLKNNSYEEIELKQGCQDTLIATVTDLGDNVDLTGQVISVEMLKADETFIIQSTDITVNANKITVILNKDLTRASGNGKLQIKMTKNGVISGSWVVNAKIKSGAIDNAIGESGNIVTIKEELDKSIVQAKVENDKTQDLIENGGAATKGELTEVRSDLAEILKNLIIIKPTFSISKINEILQSGHGNYIFKNGDYLLNTNENIAIKSNSRVIFEPKANIIYNDKTSGTYACINLLNVENIIIEYPNLIGNKIDHVGTTGEYGHGINIHHARNIKITKPSIKDTWGDGIYIGYSYQFDDLAFKNDNILVDKPIIYNCSRNGISICGGDNIKIIEPYIEKIDRVNPMAGIDIEPENKDKTKVHLNNLVIESPITKSCSCGIGYYLSNIMDDKECNIIVNNHTDILSDAISAHWSYCKNGSVNVYNSKGIDIGLTPLVIKNANNTFKTRYKGIDVNGKSKTSPQPAILLETTMDVIESGNIKIEDVSVSTTTNKYYPFLQTKGTNKFKNVELINFSSNYWNMPFDLYNVDLTTLMLKNIDNMFNSSYSVNNNSLTTYYKGINAINLSAFNTYSFNENLPNGEYEYNIIKSNGKAVTLSFSSGINIIDNKRTYISVGDGCILKFYKLNNDIIITSIDKSKWSIQI